MTEHRARCRCGALTAVATGEPVRISVCHCLDCQRRSGSAFAAQVRFPSADVMVEGETANYHTRADSGGALSFRFCPTCGDTIAYEIEKMPGVTAIPLGAFENPRAFTPKHSVWEKSKHDWVTLTGVIEHHD